MRKQNGDTLIEVMIALAIIGSVIAISYATASRALRTGRAAQERTEAVKFVESQVESLKVVASTKKQTLFANSPSLVVEPTFCVDSATNIYTENALPADVIADGLVTNTTGAPTAGQVYHFKCAVGQDARYKLSIVRTCDASFKCTFVVRARWERIGGGKDEVAVYYRLHRDMF